MTDGIGAAKTAFDLVTQPPSAAKYAQLDPLWTPTRRWLPRRTRWRDSHPVTNAVAFVGFRCVYPAPGGR